jgi:beta-glucanase (GH16 family)
VSRAALAAAALAGARAAAARAAGALVAAALAAGCASSPARPDASAATSDAFPAASPDGALAGRTITWRDEFDGPSGQSPDPSRWTIEEGGDGFGNNELEFMTARPSNVSLDGEGHLAVTARQESYQGHGYTSGRLNTLTHFTQQYGRFEARIQMPTGQGMWPAFWMLGDDIGTTGWPGCGEIDIVELRGQQPAVVHGTVHGPGYSGGGAISAARSVTGGVTGGFHVYSVEWSPGRAVIAVDDQPYFTVTPGQLPAGARWVFDHPFGVIFDLAVGGNFVGAPDGSTRFPQTMLVDWVRVYGAAP